jgi:hypothetical protein
MGAGNRGKGMGGGKSAKNYPPIPANLHEKKGLVRISVDLYHEVALADRGSAARKRGTHVFWGCARPVCRNYPKTKTVLSPLVGVLTDITLYMVV